MPLTAAGYENKAVTSLNNAGANIYPAKEKGVAWTSIGGVYAFLAKQQQAIDKENVPTKPLIISAAAKSYQANAEAQLVEAEKWVVGFLGFNLDPVQAAARANIAQQWAYLYVQSVREDNKVVTT